MHPSPLTCHRILRTAAAVALVAGLALPFAVQAQQPGEQAGGGRGMGLAGMQRVTGEVTAVTADTITVKAEDGTVSKIVTTPNTRMFKGQGVPFKVADLKPGDGVMAAGNLDAPNKTLHAALLVATDAEQVKKLREGLGKVYIAGKVVALDADNARMTVLRPDNVTQVIAFDETTSFRRGRGGRGGGNAAMLFGAPGGATPPASATAPPAGESITLADIKVGDQVAGQGSVKNGNFVPTQLSVSTPGQRPRRPDGAGTPDTKPQP